MATDLAGLCVETLGCRRCPRLVEWRERVGVEKRAAYRDEEYWARPISGFGDVDARIVVVGLAPAAHGGNRTGRVFTGDRSGDWLFAALYRAGLADRPTSVRRDDGLVLRDLWVTAAVKCAPPANKPSIAERDTCVSTFLVRELELLVHKRVVVCLGRFAYDVVCSTLGVRRRPGFGHGVEVVADGLTVLCSFHPSQQNTFTGRLTEEMQDTVLQRAVMLATAP